MKTYMVTIRPIWAKYDAQYSGQYDEIQHVEFGDAFSVFDVYDMMQTYQSRHSHSTDIIVEEISASA